ncbi:hypothetical protein DY000_02003807 [Brassica cretica]|uniref:Protein DETOXIFICATION n=1 Tax=Brassica cretica TaxID=69181 RepID=A0ABQ7BZ38_BRACR|nr:hypothetical protein DY000_02003807 [Brassica cretica]
MTETSDHTSVPASVVTQIPFLVIFKDLTHVFSKDAIGREILGIAFPAALALAADPIASLIDTAYIGRLGAVELAAVGVSIAIFNQASRITIFPIVSVTTSFVAQEDTMEKMKEDEAKKNKLVHANTLAVQDSLEKGIASPTSNNINQPQQTPALDAKPSCGNKANKKEKKNIKSASTAMIIGLILGLVQAIVLIFSSKVLLGVMGVKPNSAVLSPAHKYLTIRSLGAPALLLSLSMQGIFRGFKDTKTPLYATIVADVINIILDPIFIFVLHLGVSGAAIAHVISQYFMTLILFIRLATSDTKSSSGNKANKKGKKNIKSASTAMIIGLILGLVQAIFLIFSSKVLLGVMGVKPNSAVLSPAHKYLTIRSLGAPALLLSLSMQGIFRGFKDTKTPLYATIVADVINIILDPIFIFVLHLGVSGAAIAHVISQYFMTLILFIRLASKVNLMPPNFRALQFGKFLKNGGLLLARTIAVTFCQTLAAAMAARLGTTPMAAFQICLQVWLTTSLLADGLAVAGQAILACSFAEKDDNKVSSCASRVLQVMSRSSS